jgi:hypothetical protein
MRHRYLFDCQAPPEAAIPHNTDAGPWIMFLTWAKADGLAPLWVR